MKNWPLLAFLVFSLSCTEQKNKPTTELEWQSVPLKYATGFTIEKASAYYRISILEPYKGAPKALTYIFYPTKDEAPKIPADATIALPVKNIVCTSTTHIPLLDYLDESAALTGFPTLDYISSEKMRKRINSGKVSELGIDEALNLEKLIALRPDLVMAYSLTGDLGQYQLIQETGIPVILNAEYLETHPLGRAEWLKLAGVIFDKLSLADSIFNKIETNYLAAEALVKDGLKQPSVLSGVLYGDSWYLPGGQNYGSTLLRDAGFDFFWKNDTSSAFLPLSFETVFDRGRTADFWIGVASFTSLAEIAAADLRYTRFTAYQEGNVYSYNKLIGERGGSEFLELGYLRPDLILKDLVKIGHPELLPEHELFFHFKLP